MNLNVIWLFTNVNILTSLQKMQNDEIGIDAS